MINPFFVYILAFGVTLLAYGLDWATIYPPLSADVVSFFLWTFLAAALLAVFVGPALRRPCREVSELPKWMSVALVIAMAADIGYAGGIPLFMVASGSDFDYSQFGIPTFHVILGTFAPAYAAVRFSDFVVSRRWFYLVSALIPPIFSILTFSRGTVVLELITFSFIWLAHRGFPRVRNAIVGTVLALTALYGFGVLGDIRSPGEIERISEPSAEFRHSGVPSEFMWSYIYMTSPLANFQNTVDETARLSGRVAQFVAAELIPDFIGKRILESMDVPREDIARVSPTLNAAGMYGRAFSYLSWVGPIIMFCALSALAIGFSWMVKGSSYVIPALAVQNTLVFLCVFENMLSFTGMVMQMFWMLVFIKLWPRLHRRSTNSHVAVSV